MGSGFRGPPGVGHTQSKYVYIWLHLQFISKWLQNNADFNFRKQSEFQILPPEAKKRTYFKRFPTAKDFRMLSKKFVIVDWLYSRNDKMQLINYRSKNGLHLCMVKANICAWHTLLKIFGRFRCIWMMTLLQSSMWRKVSSNRGEWSTILSQKIINIVIS